MTATSHPRNNFIQWLWQGQEMKRLRAQLSSMPKSHGEILEQARMALSQAHRLANDPPFNREEKIPPLAGRLYCEAIYWALAALAHRREGLDASFLAPESARKGLQRAGVDLAEIADGQHAPALTALLGQFDRGALADFPPVSPALGEELASVAARLVQNADDTRRAIESIWFARLLRVAAPLFLLVCMALCTQIVLHWRQVSKETTFPWRASSTHSDPGCRSPRQGCEQDHFFFHTQFEKEPWIEFNIGEIKTVSQVTIINRTDCVDCSTRAIPLVIELATKDRVFKTVARRDADFVRWSVEFPRTEAQYLRVRVLKRSHLHLKQVRIEP
ncbi:MAG TPA: hypothetical protein VN764_01315 [Polyangiaceae bacterium]|nr:hypothetical protein [Polyangiaceae bacterium]